MSKTRSIQVGGGLIVALLTLVARPLQSKADDCKEDCLASYKTQVSECEDRYSGADNREDLNTCKKDAWDQYQSCTGGCGENTGEN